MKEVTKGCLGISVVAIIILLAIRLVFGELFGLMFMPLLMFSPFLVIIVIGAVSNLISESIKAGKWLGLGAIAGNAINNKINADAQVSSGQKFKKKNIKTNNKMLDGIINFVSPETSDSEVSEISSDDFREYEEFLKWKQAKENISKQNDIE